MLRIGVLGAARITRDALIKPARKVDPNITDSVAAIETMQTIDDVYLAAGMDVRQPS